MDDGTRGVYRATWRSEPVAGFGGSVELTRVRRTKAGKVMTVLSKREWDELVELARAAVA